MRTADSVGSVGANSDSGSPTMVLKTRSQEANQEVQCSTLERGRTDDANEDDITEEDNLNW